MSYIDQYIKETLITGNQKFKNPLHVVMYLLFKENEFDVVDGNPCVIVDFDKRIPFESYFKDERSYQELVAIYERCHRHKTLTTLYDEKNDNDEFQFPLWEQIVDVHNTNIAKIFDLDEKPIRYEMGYWNEFLEDFDENVSYERSLAFNFNKNTEKELLTLVLFLVNDLIGYYEVNGIENLLYLIDLKEKLLGLSA